VPRRLPAGPTRLGRRRQAGVRQRERPRSRWSAGGRRVVGGWSPALGVPAAGPRPASLPVCLGRAAPGPSRTPRCRTRAPTGLRSSWRTLGLGMCASRA